MLKDGHGSERFDCRGHPWVQDRSCVSRDDRATRTGQNSLGVGGLRVCFRIKKISELESLAIFLNLNFS